MSSLRPPPSPSPSPSPVQGKNVSARASMGPAARPSAGTQQGFALASPRPGGGPPSGRPTSELLGSATFQTPEGELSPRFYHFLSSFFFFCFWIEGWRERLCIGTCPVPNQSIWDHVMLFYASIASLSPALRPPALLASVLPFPPPPCVAIRINSMFSSDIALVSISELWF